MAKTCEFIHLTRARIPKFEPHSDSRPFDVSKLPVIGREIGLGLAMGTVFAHSAVDRASTILSRMEGIYTWESKKPLELSLKIAIGTLGFGAIATAATCYFTR